MSMVDSHQQRDGSPSALDTVFFITDCLSKLARRLLESNGEFMH
jgi:hypothetical protein